MCKCLEMIKKFRSGNRVLVKTDYCRSVSLCRRNAEEPVCKIEMKDKNEVLLLDVVAVLAAVWAVGRLCRAIRALFH